MDTKLSKKHKKKKTPEDNPSGKHEEPDPNSDKRIENEQEKVANLTDVVNNNEHKKKKKDKKRKDPSIEIGNQDRDGNHDENMDNSTDLPRKRPLDDNVEDRTKKKKKKRSKDDLETAGQEESQVNAVANETPVDDDGDDNADPKKKRKKKKKKKKMSEPAPGGKMSIRRMKWEKHCQRQADEKASAKDQLKTQTLNYLSQWKHDRANWKFMKARQVWLYKTKFSPTYIPEASWPILLEYFESCQGNIRKMLLDDANKVITKMDEWSEKNAGVNPKDSEDEAADDENPDEDKPDPVSYKRARDLIQCLQE